MQVLTSNTFRTLHSGLYTAVPTGAVLLYAGPTAPPNWLFCDGSAIHRVKYAALFAAVGTTYGTGNGATTFNLPDLRSVVQLNYIIRV